MQGGVTGSREGEREREWGERELVRISWGVGERSGRKRGKHLSWLTAI